LVDTTNGQTILSNLSLAGTTYTPTTPLTNGHNYQWQVQAFDNNGYLGTPTNNQTFSVVPKAVLLGDVNGDGIVNSQDLALITANWLSNGPVGDVNGDGIVNAQDLALVSSNWLATLAAVADEIAGTAQATTVSSTGVTSISVTADPSDALASPTDAPRMSSITGAMTRTWPSELAESATTNVVTEWPVRGRSRS
ncbi:MAG TPA: dockerin type I domain-containing protein, partial [Pirellulales bacterium]|nr:dockerin type I domain-containing protein [Pirellulales bacterium]